MTQGCKERWSSSPKQANGAPRSSAARPTSEDDTATTFELFFDLVYVFAMTQVTGYIVHAHDALGVIQGLLVLALLW